MTSQQAGGFAIPPPSATAQPQRVYADNVPGGRADFYGGRVVVHTGGAGGLSPAQVRTGGAGGLSPAGALLADGLSPVGTTFLPLQAGRVLPAQEQRPAYANAKYVTPYKESQKAVGHGKRLVALAVLMCVGASALPVLGASALLQDANAVFWIGRFLPFMVILACVGVTLLLVATLYLLRDHAAPSTRNALTMSLVANIFTALLGLSLMLLALPLSSKLYATADQIAIGCVVPSRDMRTLMYYSQVMHNMRTTPNCTVKESIADCDGYKENEYTTYLRDLEEEFQCVPFCSLAPVPVPAPALLQQTKHKHSLLNDKRRSSSASTKAATIETESLATKQEPRLLFSRSQTTTTSCWKMIPVRLNVLAWCFGDLMFWEGFILLLVSVIASAFSAIDGCRGGSSHPFHKSHE